MYLKHIKKIEENLKKNLNIKNIFIIIISRVSIYLDYMFWYNIEKTKVI